MDQDEMRRQAKLARQGIDARLRETAAIAVAMRLQVLPAFATARMILGYVGIKNEMDSWPLLRRAWALAKIVALPRVEKSSKKISFWRVEGSQDLEEGPFGILQPKAIESRLVKPRLADLILVPGLLFDRAGGRIGWGHGYYDRYLADEGKDAVSIGVAFDIQVMDRLPQASHDRSVDWLLTESQAVDCRGVRKN